MARKFKVFQTYRFQMIEIQGSIALRRQVCPNKSQRKNEKKFWWQYHLVAEMRCNIKLIQICDGACVIWATKMRRHGDLCNPHSNILTFVLEVVNTRHCSNRRFAHKIFGTFRLHIHDALVLGWAKFYIITCIINIRCNIRCWTLFATIIFWFDK